MLKKAYQSIHRCIRLEETINFDVFRLTVNKRDNGGRQYRQPTYWADVHCHIEQEIVDCFGPTVFLDIGANYGFTSLLHFSKNPNCQIIAVEPSPLLIPFLRRNFQDNKCDKYKLVSAICSDNQNQATFSLNPASSQDNRVLGEKGWPIVPVSSTTIDALLEQALIKDFVYIKVDTQGFEEKVLSGGRNFLLQNSNWLLKMEFAPKWLTMQGTEPLTFLKHLINTFRVVELPKRSRFKGDSLQELFRYPLAKQDCADFIDYTQKLANGDGWCDLLIAPLESRI